MPWWLTKPQAAQDWAHAWGEMDTRPYLDYLDKEMTIMEVLSAVAIAAPAAKG
jgi:hypothetical protein